MIAAPLLLLFAAAPPGGTAESIMARVAENQDRALRMRSSYVYRQSVLVRLNHTNGKLAREEYSEFTVLPDAHGVRKERTRFDGKYVRRGRTVEYHDRSEAGEQIHIDIDGAVVSDLADDLTSDKTKDGIARDLFPLTADQQRKYTFHLEGLEDYRGISVYRITFEPRKDEHEENSAWAGEALIDSQEFQPVLVTTHQAFKIPMVVKAVLGTNVEHMGFKVTYKKFDEGIWFPVVYGGELRVRALFLYGRRIGISMQNTDFHRTDASSTVTYKTIE